MGIPGSYLYLTMDGSTIAETTDVSLKFQAKAIDKTTKDSGFNAEFMGGTVKVAIAGTFLVASDGSNWDTLWAAFEDGTEVDVNYLRHGTQFLSGTGIVKKLTLKGGNSDELVTGTYGILHTGEFNTESVGDAILTEDGYYFETEDGQTVILEDGEEVGGAVAGALTTKGGIQLTTKDGRVIKKK